MIRYKLFNILFLSSLFFSTTTLAQEFPVPMSPPRLVNDFTQFLSGAETQNLESKLLQFNNQTSTQIYLVTVPTIHGYDIDDYAARLAEKWGVGQQGKDNGIMILIVPKSSQADGEIAITVGYGLEGVVPDIVANRIITNEIIPSFKQGSNFGGIFAGVETLMSLTEGEFTADEYIEQTQSSRGGAIGGTIVFIIVMIIMMAGRSRSGRYNSVGRNLPFWLLLGMMGSSGGSHQGMFSNFSSGSGGFGGFGGGGGGSFGGGGASGSW